MPLPQCFTIETERLLLRALTPETYQQLYAACTDAEIMTFLGLKEEDELAEDRYRQVSGRDAWHTSFVYFQLIEKMSGTIIGACNFHFWYTRHARAEIGYALKEDQYKRQGVMKEAIVPVLDYGFEQMGLNRVEASVSPANEASIRLLTSMGFTREALLRGHYCRNGAIEDSLMYGLLRNEYFDQKQ